MYNFFKRCFDLLFAVLFLMVFSPVYVLTFIIIKIVSPGPAIYKAKRVGKDGKLFNCYKFRTMIPVKNNEGAEGKKGDKEWSTVSVAGDSRITPFGAKLRHYKLDELPGLWNVLIGDMSFVGPRPDVPGYADMLTGDDRRMLELRPGITGPASLKYRDEEELLAKVDNPIEYNDKVIFPDKVRINLYYLDHYSFWKDIQMIIYTVLGMKMEYGGEVI